MRRRLALLDATRPNELIAGAPLLWCSNYLDIVLNPHIIILLRLHWCTLQPPFSGSNCRDVATVQDFAAFWRDEVLLPGDTLVAAGVAYHVADMVLPQLTIVVSEAAAPPPAAALAALLAPFCAALGDSGDAVLVQRLRQGLFEGVEGEVRVPSEGRPLRSLDPAALAEQLFELGERASLGPLAFGGQGRARRRRRPVATICVRLFSSEGHHERHS